MSGVRTLKLRRSTAVQETEQLAAPSMSSDMIIASMNNIRPSVRPSSASSVSAAPIPLEPPYDRQCIMRFPLDIAEVVRGLLRSPGTTDQTEVIRINQENQTVNGHEYRLYSVSIFENQRQRKEFDMMGALVDLPTFVESYKTINKGVTVTKSADISQMIICFRRAEFSKNPPSEELQQALNLLYPSGLTPPTSNIRYRKFRPPPSKEEVINLRSAEDLIESVMNGGALEWVVETEVDEDEADERMKSEPENVWTPTEEMLAQLRKAGYIDENGDIVSDDVRMEY